MKVEMKEKLTYGFWGFVGGAVVAMIIGFVWGGWTTSSTSQAKSDAAVLANQAAICVAQFIKEPKSKERLDEFEKIESYKRSEFIQKGGWDKMPGQKEASYDVANACVTGIEALIKK
jgi:hypothetical protein